VILVDAGPLIALGDEDSLDYKRCREALRSARPPRLIPGPVVAEVCHLLGTRLGPQVEADFLTLLAGPAFSVVNPEDNDLLRAAQLVVEYGDLPLGGTDAIVVAVAERLNIATVATLDQRHFHIVRPRHVTAFHIVPEH